MGQIRHPASTFRSKKDRKDAVAVIAEERGQRTDEQQLKLLDKRLGKGVGATKERARLKAAIKKAKQDAEAEEKATKKAAKKTKPTN